MCRSFVLGTMRALAVRAARWLRPTRGSSEASFSASWQLPDGWPEGTLSIYLLPVEVVLHHGLQAMTYDVFTNGNGELAVVGKLDVYILRSVA